MSRDVMRKKARRSGVQVDRLRFLEPALRRWCSLMKDDEWDLGDAPWWYNERASLSVLAGALWGTGGWAFEEFATRKDDGRGKRAGRGDLMFEVGHHRIMAEAKQSWPVLHKTRDSALARVRAALSTARDEAGHLPLYGYKRMAIVFVSPRLPAAAKTDGDRRVRQFVRGLLVFEAAAVAWAFPKRARFPRSDTGHSYPRGCRSTEALETLMSNSRHHPVTRASAAPNRRMTPKAGGAVAADLGPRLRAARLAERWRPFGVISS